jgi:hypothetical protein
MDKQLATERDAREAAEADIARLMGVKREVCVCVFVCVCVCVCVCMLSSSHARQAEEKRRQLEGEIASKTVRAQGALTRRFD